MSLPDEYVQFLKMLNGFAWNGIELFGTDRVANTQTDYIQNDIVSENQDFHDHYESLNHCLYFGHEDEDFYVFNTEKENKRWEVRGLTGWGVMKGYDTFEELFVAVVGRRIRRFTTMKTIDEVLNKITENDNDAMIVRPATAEDLKLCQKDMADTEMPPIPQEYTDFLSRLNGFAWNGIEFFSTDQVTDTESDFTLNDIVSANEDFTRHNEGLEHCVYLGRADDDLYVYNTKNGHYEVLDMTGRDVMEEFGSFEAMFVGVVAPRI
jgi:hypothetical protein